MVASGRGERGAAGNKEREEEGRGFLGVGDNRPNIGVALFLATSISTVRLGEILPLLLVLLLVLLLLLLLPVTGEVLGDIVVVLLLLLSFSLLLILLLLFLIPFPDPPPSFVFSLRLALSLRGSGDAWTKLFPLRIGLNVFLLIASSLKYLQ